MDQFGLIPYSMYQSQSRRLYQEKKEVVPKDFGSIYSDVTARLKTSNNKHLIDFISNFPRIRLSQSEKNILDNRDTKKIDCRLCVCTKAKKNTEFSDIYFSILEASQIPPKLVINNQNERQGNLDPFQNLNR